MRGGGEDKGKGGTGRKGRSLAKKRRKCEGVKEEKERKGEEKTQRGK